MKKDNIGKDKLKNNEEVIGDNLSFAGTEAYKQLRTNIMFSLPKTDENSHKGKIIAVTAPNKGEGKSTTSINLAYSLAQMDVKVLLIEADLRLPVMSDRLKLNQSPGLSNILVGDSKIATVLQQVGKNKSFFAITAGEIPPNPSELLSSSRMEHILKGLSETFDYIIIDLPPLNVVTDAAAISNNVDGYIMIARHNVTSLRDLDAAVSKLKMVDAKILGYVLNGKKIHEKRYYNRYGTYYK